VRDGKSNDDSSRKWKDVLCSAIIACCGEEVEYN